MGNNRRRVLIVENCSRHKTYCLTRISYQCEQKGYVFIVKHLLQPCDSFEIKKPLEQTLRALQAGNDSEENFERLVRKTEQSWKILHSVSSY